MNHSISFTTRLGTAVDRTALDRLPCYDASPADLIALRSNGVENGPRTSCKGGHRQDSAKASNRVLG
jgi:hypothetical protein